MSDFKVIYRADRESAGDRQLTWEPGCPLAFEAIQISRNTETGEAFLQAKLQNVSGRTVQSFEAEFAVKYADGGAETVCVKPLDADVPPGAMYAIVPVGLNASDAVSAEGRVLAIRQSGKAQWVSSGSTAAFPVPAILALPEKAYRERARRLWPAAEGDWPHRWKIANHAFEAHEDWWLCPCGQVNVERERCCRCGAPLSELSATGAEDEAWLYARADERNGAEKAKRKKRTKSIVWAIVIAVVLVGVGVGLILFHDHQEKQAQYDAAMALYNEGRYEAALNAFSNMGDFSDATHMEGQSAQGLYEVAQQAYEGAQYKEAARLFNWLGRLGIPGAAEMEHKTESALNHMETLKAYIGSDLSSRFGLSDDRVDYEPCTFRFNDDGTCSVSFSGLEQEEFNGVWEGTWDAGALTVTLPGFPGGEEWRIDSEDEVLRVNGSSRTGTGEMYLPLRNDGGYFFLSRP